MRIVYVHYMSPESAHGGMGVHIRSSAQALRKIGHEVLVLHNQAGSRASLNGSRPRNRSLVRRLAAKYGYQARSLLRTPVRLRRELSIVRDFRPDVVLVRYEFFEHSTWFLGLPLAVEVNATTSEIVKWRSDSIKVYPFTSILEHAILNRANSLFCISNNLKAQLVSQGVDSQRIDVIPNGADTDKFHPQVNSEIVRKKYALGDSIVIGFLGSFGRWHDIGTIAAIVPAITSRYPNVRFLLAGANFDDLPGTLQRKFETVRDKVVFTGVVPVHEAPLYLAAMDIALTLFPNIDPFTPSVVKLFEYMAAGKAIVATGIGQQAEVLRDGIDGLLVGPGNTEDVLRKVKGLIDDRVLRERLGRAARSKLTANYTWEHNAQRVTQVCEKAIRYHNDSCSLRPGWRSWF